MINPLISPILTVYPFHWTGHSIEKIGRSCV